MEEEVREEGGERSKEGDKIDHGNVNIAGNTMATSESSNNVNSDGKEEESDFGKHSKEAEEEGGANTQEHSAENPVGGESSAKVGADIFVSTEAQTQKQMGSLANLENPQEEWGYRGGSVKMVEGIGTSQGPGHEKKARAPD